MRNKSLHTQVAKFVVIGMSNAIISYIVFIFFYNKILPGDGFFSQCISYAAGILWSFTWNKKWTFSEKTHSWVAFSPFLILQLLLLLLSAFLLTFAKHNLDWNISLIWVCVMATITIMNFVLTKHLVFKV